MFNISIFIPCYNEQAVLPETWDQLKKLLSNLQEEKQSIQNRKLFSLMMAVKMQHGSLSKAMLQKVIGHQVLNYRVIAVIRMRYSLDCSTQREMPLLV